MPTVVEAFTLALQHHQAGRLQEAEALCRQILHGHPNHPDALHLLGMIAYQVGQHAVAIDYLNRAIALEPKSAELHNDIGRAYRLHGKLAEAESHYRQALALKPAFAEAHNNLGNVLQNQGKHEEAVAHYKQGLALMPASADAHNNLGAALNAQGKLAEAAVHFRQAVSLRPNYVEAHLNLGMTCETQGHMQEAEACYRQALTLQPASAEVLSGMGNVLKNQGRLEEAEAHYRRALALQPDSAGIHNNLGTVLHPQGRLAEAEACYRQALILNPAFTMSYINLGDVLKDKGEMEDAETCYRRALSLQPHDGLRIKLATTLPVIFASAQELLAVRKKFEEKIDALLQEALTLEDPVKDVRQTNFLLVYHGLNDREVQVKMARLYERACPSLLYTAPHCASWPRSRAAGKIKIGFISQFLKDHSMGRITNGVFDHLSREKFCVCAIFVPPMTHDEFSNAFQRKADKTVFLPGNLHEARATIAAEKFDILFYPEIGMDPFTYFLAFARLAPIQCVSFGHPVTSGIKNIDYFVSAENFEPQNAEKHYSERLIKLKSPIAYYYKPEIPHPLQSRRDFGLSDAEHVYVCPHTLFKFHPDFDEILAGIMKADPLARLVIIHFPSAQWAEKLLQRLQQTIPNAKDRITVLPPLRERAWLSLLAVSDVILDTVHFSGFVSGHYAIAVGTPVVTWPGKFLRGRLMLALYKELGVLDCIADSPSRYVEIAVRLGTDPAYREDIKARIRANSHRLYENPAVIDEYERVFLKMAKDAGLMPVSVD